MTLAEVASLLGATLVGEPDKVVTGLQTLEKSAADNVSFLANSRYLKHLQTTRAAAVIIHKDFVDECPVSALVMDNPYLGYARLSQYFSYQDYQAGIHPSATIAADAVIAETATVGANVVVGSRSKVADNAVILANTVIGADCSIGASSKLAANVTVYDGVSIGQRALVHSSAVIGSDGFGFAPADGKWNKIA